LEETSSALVGTYREVEEVAKEIREDDNSSTVVQFSFLFVGGALAVHLAWKTIRLHNENLNLGKLKSNFKEALISVQFVLPQITFSSYCLCSHCHIQRSSVFER